MLNVLQYFNLQMKHKQIYLKDTLIIFKKKKELESSIFKTLFYILFLNAKNSKVLKIIYHC